MESGDLFYNLVEKAKDVKLTEKERNSMFLAVDKFVERNPLPSMVADVAPSKPVAQPVAETGSANAGFLSVKSFFSFWDVYGQRVGVAFAILLVVGVGTSFAAQNSLPGDFLYPVRVNVNEEVKGAFLSGVSRSEYEVSRVKNRVEDIKKLALEGRLSEDVEIKIGSRINAHLAVVQKDMNSLSERGELKSVFELSSALESSLADGENTITELAMNDASNNQLKSIKDVIDGPRQISTKVRQLTEEQILSRNVDDDFTLTVAKAKSGSARKMLETVESKIMFDESNVAASASSNIAVDTFVANDNVRSAKVPSTTMASPASLQVQIDLETEYKTEVTFDRVKRARELIAQGDQKLQEGKYNEAYALFEESFRLTQNIQSSVEVDNANIKNELDGVILDLESRGPEIDTDAEAKAETGRNISTNDQNTDKAQIVDVKKASNKAQLIAPFVQ